MIMPPTVKASLVALHQSTPWWVKLLLPIAATALLTWGSTATSHDRDINARVSALEQSKGDTKDRLDRIENKLDHVIDVMLGEKPEKH